MSLFLIKAENQLRDFTELLSETGEECGRSGCSGVSVVGARDFLPSTVNGGESESECEVEGL